MCTEFPCCEKDAAPAGGGLTHPLASGGSGSGPRALRPERLEWLFNIRGGSQIAAFPKCLHSSDRVQHPTLLRHPGEGRGPIRLSKGVPACAGMTKKVSVAPRLGLSGMSRALRPFFPQNSDRRRARQKHPLHFSFPAGGRAAMR